MHLSDDHFKLMITVSYINIQGIKFITDVTSKLSDDYYIN